MEMQQQSENAVALVEVIAHNSFIKLLCKGKQHAGHFLKRDTE
jgi:hypothetical protein